MYFSLNIIYCVEGGQEGEVDLDVVNNYANNIGTDLAVGTLALAEAAGRKLCKPYLCTMTYYIYMDTYVVSVCMKICI